MYRMTGRFSSAVTLSANICPGVQFRAKESSGKSPPRAISAGKEKCYVTAAARSMQVTRLCGRISTSPWQCWWRGIGSHKMRAQRRSRSRYLARWLYSRQGRGRTKRCRSRRSRSIGGDLFEPPRRLDIQRRTGSSAASCDAHCHAGGNRRALIATRNIGCRTVPSIPLRNQQST